MKTKLTKIDRLIITSEKDVVSVFEDFLNKDWKKINKNRYNLFNYCIKVENKDKKTIIDIWEKDKLTGFVTSGKISFFHFLTFIQIKLWVKSLIKKIKGIDINCDIEHTYTLIEGNSLLTSIYLFFKTTPVLIVVISLIFVLILLIYSKIK